jgi:hypothetical protein
MSSDQGLANYKVSVQLALSRIRIFYMSTQSEITSYRNGNPVFKQYSIRSKADPRFNVAAMLFYIVAKQLP